MIRSLRRHLSSSALLEERGSLGLEKFLIYFSAVVVVAFVFWTIKTQLNEIAVAPGNVVPAGSVRSIQHLNGGRVSEVFVQEGDVVKQGDLLVEFDSFDLKHRIRRSRVQIKGLNDKIASTEKDYRLLKKLASEGLYSKLNLAEMGRNIAEMKGKIEELRVVIRDSEEELENMRVYAPISGRIFKMEALAKGAVYNSGQPLLEIVPLEGRLVAEVKISNQDIGHVRTDDMVKLKFETYDFSRYGSMQGRLKSISPTTMESSQGDPYYIGRVEIEKDYLTGSFQETPILPGMTLVAEIQTGSKSIMQYLLKPIFASAKQAFHER